MAEENFRCPRCGSNRFVSISLDGGYARLPQCVPCGKVHPGYWGHGSQSGNWDHGWTPRTPTRPTTAQPARDEKETT